MSTALEEARKYKNAIENELTLRLESFNKETGLHIKEIGIETIETTNIGDAAPQYKYRVWTTIEI